MSAPKIAADALTPEMIARVEQWITHLERDIPNSREDALAFRALLAAAQERETLRAQLTKWQERYAVTCNRTLGPISHCGCPEGTHAKGGD